MSETTESNRLNRLYERLRERLLDMSLRNPLLSYSHRPQSRRQLRFVDGAPEKVYALLATGAALEIVPLSEPNSIPADERTLEFVAELDRARVSDVEYLKQIQNLQKAGQDNDFELDKAEQGLRDQVRAKLELPPRPNRKTISPADRARELEIDPALELHPSSSKPLPSNPVLQTLKWPNLLDSLLTHIAADERLAEQETGLSTLHLALGFLEWREQDDSAPKIAPLLLLPVKLERRRQQGRTAYFLSTAAETAEANLSLQKKLERDFGRHLPKFEAGEEEIGSVEDYFSEVTKAMDGMKGWCVRRYLTLGHFAFGRFAMYADLASGNWEDSPTNAELVRSIISGAETSGDPDYSPLTPPEDYPIDDPEFENLAPFLIHDADASQHSALIDVMQGKNLVIQGPPGTGKSQTITNIIANALAANKKVLFLSEKQAALDVVKRRLDAAGLGDFCLELHSDKAASKLVIESLKKRHELGYQNSYKPAQTDAMWEITRRKMRAYVVELHDKGRSGEAPFDSIWRALRARTEIGPDFDQFRFVELPQGILDTEAASGYVNDEVASYAGLVAEFTSAYGQPSESAWSAITFLNPGGISEYGLIRDLERLRGSTAQAAALLNEAADLVAAGIGAAALSDLETLANMDEALPKSAPSGTLLERITGMKPGQLNEIIDLQTAMLDAEAKNIAELKFGDVPGDEDEFICRLTDAVNAPFADITPAELYQEFSRRLGMAVSQAEAAKLVLPALKALSIFPGNFPCAGVDAVALASEGANQLTDDARSWFSWRPQGGVAAFDRAHSEWSKLAADEARWRGRFPGHTHALWPTPDHLWAAAAFAAKGTLSRMFLKGDAKKFASLKELLGAPINASLSPDELEALAAHAQAVSEFLNNRSHRQLLGASWAGLDTPFDLIAETLAFRDGLGVNLAKRPYGSETFRFLSELDVNGLKQLAAAFAGLKAIPQAALEALRSCDDDSLQSRLSEAEKRKNRAKALLSFDPEQRLTRFSHTFRVLRASLQALDARRHAADRLSAHPLAAIANELAGTREAIQEVKTALAWVDAVCGLKAPNQLTEALLSREAGALRARIASTAQQGLAAKEALKADLLKIEQTHSISGFSANKSLSASPQMLSDMLDRVLSMQDELSAYLSLCRKRAALESGGLAALLNRAESLQIDAGRLPSLLSGAISQRRAERVRENNSVLSQASGVELDAQRRMFIERDKQKIEADRSIVRAMLRGIIPPAGNRSGAKRDWTELELLRNEFSKEMRFVPVRDLIRRAGAALQQMKPCFMMSPLSLAKFLPAGKIQFDLLIIDEASQMRPEDALGGLLRARQLVVVGDQKQLPPTDFFSRLGSDAAATDDDEDFEDIDAESILEICLKTFQQTRMLRWHYRSRCESLISFSNKEFYKGGLITFPMARPNSFSVDLIRVDGSYEARCNPIEAQAVAAEAVQFMRRFADSDPETIPTLGVVAVNSEQRDLILEEVRRLEANDELIALYKDKVSEKGEPLFVKNLENVQGDERDFIFISMTYGPKPGTNLVLQRFGPINGKQGHRRLNVLFSRARIRLGLFTSFGSDDVKPSATSAEGTHVLKRYLAYAESGGMEPARVTGREPDSDFEIEVANRLRARGYVVDYQVGVSGFRIDLGVRHPDHPERFLAGVECDGARYHSSKSARDRDRLREQVLNGLGWEIIRVWSTDWFTSANRQTELLVKRLEELRNKPAPAHEDYAPASALRSHSSGGPSAADPSPSGAGLRLSIDC